MSEKRRRAPEHEKFSSPDFDRQQRQRTGDPNDNLPSRLRGRLSWDVRDEDEQRDSRAHPSSGQHRPDDERRPRSSTRDDKPAAQQQSNQNSGGSGGGRARIEFSLDRAPTAPGTEEVKPRVSSKYGSTSGGKDAPAPDPPVLKRLSRPGGRDEAPPPAAAAAAAADRAGREPQRGEGSGRRRQSPGLSGPRGADRLRERERERGHGDRERERDRDASQRRAAAAAGGGAAAPGRDGSRDPSRPRSGRDEGVRPERGRDPSRPADRPRSREGSRERAGQGSKDRAREQQPSRERGGREPSREGSRARGAPHAGQDDRPQGTRDARDEGFVRPPRREPPAQQQQQEPFPRPRLPHVQWDEISKADAMLAAVRARHAGLVEQQLSHLILTQALATENVWDKACKAANIPPELMDGPLVAMARRSDCDAALQSRASAHLMPPLDPRRPSSTLEVAGEDVYIQQLQAVINRYEQQSAAPYSTEVWALKGSGDQPGKQDAAQQAGADERVSYSLLLPTELRGILWGV